MHILNKWIYIVMCLCFVPALTQAQSNRATDEANEKLSQISAEISTIRSNLSKIQTNYSSEEKVLGKIEVDINTVHQKITQTELATHRAEAELNTLQARVTALTLNYAKKLALLKEGLAFHYRHYEKNWARRLDIQTPRYLSRYRQHINLAKLRYFHTLEKEVQHLALDQSSLNEKKATLESLYNAFATQKELLKHQQSERQSLLAQLQHQISDTQKRLTVRKKEQWELEQVLMSLHQKTQPSQVDTSAKANGFHALKGQLASPIKGYKLLSRELNKNGVFTCPPGTDITAVHEGQVIFSEWLRGYGLLLIVDHNDGFISLYGHNEAVFKKLGDKVKIHEVIARAGSTGGTSKSGLYFELRKDGRPLPLAQWLHRSELEELYESHP